MVLEKTRFTKITEFFWVIYAFHLVCHKDKSMFKVSYGIQKVKSHVELCHGFLKKKKKKKIHKPIPPVCVEMYENI